MINDDDTAGLDNFSVAAVFTLIYSKMIAYV